MTAEDDSMERTPLLHPVTSAIEAPGIVEYDTADTSTIRGALIVGLVGNLVLLQAFNISIIMTIQSSVAEDLGAFEHASWFTTSFLIAMSSIAPLVGRLCQTFSPRLCVFSSSLVLSLGLVITAASTTFHQFVLGRIVTGAGCGGMYIVASVMSIQMTRPKYRGLFIGLVSTSMTVGVSFGAILAGALEPKIGWGPLFGFQAPIGLACGIGLLLLMPKNGAFKNSACADDSVHDKMMHIDYSGAVLLMATTVPFLFGLSGPRILPLPLLFSAFMLPVFILNEFYCARDPIIPLSVLSSRATLFTCLATVGFMMTRWIVLFYTPVYALAVRGWTPAAAGSILLPTNAGFAIGGITVGSLHIKRTGSFYVPTLVAMAAFPLTMIVIAYISTPAIHWGLYLTMVFLNGFATGATVSYALVHLLHLTSPEVHPIVISLIATFRGFAGSFGSAASGGYFARTLRRLLTEKFAEAGLEHREDLTRQLLGGPALVYKLKGVEKAAALSAYEDTLKALFFGSVILASIATMAQAGTGWKSPVQKEDTKDTGHGSSHEVVTEADDLLIAA